MKRFVIVVDMQRDFVAADGALPVPGAEALIAPMNAWLASLRPADVTGVLFTLDTHLPEVYARSEEAEQFPLHCVKDAPGWSLMVAPSAVDPAIPTYTLEKGVFDMWEEPDITLTPGDRSEPIEREAFFAQLKAAGVQDVTVVGGGGGLLRALGRRRPYPACLSRIRHPLAHARHRPADRSRRGRRMGRTSGQSSGSRDLSAPS